MDSSAEQIRVIAVAATTVRQAEAMILGCEFCHSEEAEIPLDWIMDRVTGRRGSTTDYILTKRAHCPNCKHEITEKTLVEPKTDE